MKYLTIPPTYKLNKKITQLIAEIEANKAVIDSIDIPLALEQNIRRQSILGSAIFSARVEGNPLTTGEIQSFSDLAAKDQKSLEIANLYRIIEHICSKMPNIDKKINISQILRWHSQAMKNILSEVHLGKIRTEHEGLFDMAGNAIYHAPPPYAVKALLIDLLHYANTKRERIVPIKAIVSHLVFEKIHPFTDGNGRVGRLLQLAVLTNNGYGMKGLSAIEEYIDNNRQDYYRAIESSVGINCQSFIELMLEFLRDSSEKARVNIQQKIKNSSKLDLLLPRHRELVQIISEHKSVTFDFLHRRFLKISPRQLAYDLTSLIKSGYIKKIGVTRGAMYTIPS